VLCVCLLFCASAEGQKSGTAPPPAAPAPPSDVLGRTTPRGSVLGFLRAARKGDNEAAAQYLNTPLRGKDAAYLARELFVTLDRLLPARLNEVSDRPEGSLAFLTRPDEDLVGTIPTENGDVNITVEKVPVDKTAGGKSDSVWLFSAKTLAAVPALFAEANAISVEQVLPGFLVHTMFLQIALFEWLAFFFALPLLYLFTVFLSRFLGSCVGRLRRRLHRRPNLSDPVFVPSPVRLLIVAMTIRWTISRVALPLLARQFWSTTAKTITVAACVWFCILLVGWIEGIVCRRLERINSTGSIAILRLGRRTIEFLIIFVGVLAELHVFGVNLNAALAGLGVGGIAVALAAQKTLENVIGGTSIIFDKVVKVGDLLTVGNSQGFVEYIGLRSTRLRTFDRTIVFVPNGQLATVPLENFGRRDKFWFHPTVNLRYETTAAMMRSIVGGISNLLAEHTLIDQNSVRVHLIRFAQSSLEIEVFAYVFARDWVHFLDIQQDLLIDVMDVVESAGSRLAIPAQTTYVATDLPSELGHEVVKMPAGRENGGRGTGTSISQERVPK
jgi:MscS family membrane protein